jgi:hypothetical protein
MEALFSPQLLRQLLFLPLFWQHRHIVNLSTCLR